MTGLINVLTFGLRGSFSYGYLQTSKKSPLSYFSLTSLNVLKTTRCYKTARDKSLTPSELAALERERILDKKAIKLISGDKQYPNFTSKEKYLVDRFQDNILKEGVIILPNTRVWMEQLEYYEMLKKEKDA